MASAVDDSRINIIVVIIIIITKIRQSTADGVTSGYGVDGDGLTRVRYDEECVW